MRYCYKKEYPQYRSNSTSAYEEEDNEERRPDQQTRQPPVSQWTLLSCPQNSVVLTYTRGTRRKKGNTHTKQLNFMQCFPVLFYRKYHTAGSGHKPLLWRPSQQRLSIVPDGYVAEMYVPSINRTNGTMFMRPTDKLLGNNGSVLHAFL
jgi:hypothetical protein